VTTSAFSTPCECGATLPVTAADAGAAISCRCGRTVRVPRLSELRRAKGLDGVESNVRDTIARMVREGSLPWGSCCAVTGFPTADIMLFDVQCERSCTKGGGLSKAGFALLVLSLFTCFPVAIMLWLLAWDFLTTRVEEVGRNTVVTLPLRVSAAAQAEVRQSSPSRLKKLLSAVPVYLQLLTEYPDASINARQVVVNLFRRQP